LLFQTKQLLFTGNHSTVQTKHSTVQTKHSTVRVKHSTEKSLHTTENRLQSIIQGNQVSIQIKQLSETRKQSALSPKKLLLYATENGSNNNSLFIYSVVFHHKTKSKGRYINKMNAYQKAKLLMVKGIIQLCDEFPAIVSLVVAFQTAVTALKAKVAEIEETAELSSLSLAGITADKRNFKETVCQMTADIAGMIYAYAVETSNITLKEEVNLTISRLKRKSDTELVLICQAIHDRGFENKDALVDYGVTTEMLTALQTAIDDYAAASPKPRTAIGKRKTRKEIIKQLFKELDAILNERMDALMGKFRTTHPEFYQTYFNLREIVDPSTTTTTLKGTITDSADATPIKNATVTVVELGKTAQTDSAGKYSIKPIEHGKYTVKIEKDGYQTFEDDEIEIKMGDIGHLDVSLVNS